MERRGSSAILNIVYVVFENHFGWRSPVGCLEKVSGALFLIPGM